MPASCRHADEGTGSAGAALYPDGAGFRGLGPRLPDLAMSGDFWIADFETVVNAEEVSHVDVLVILLIWNEYQSP